MHKSGTTLMSKMLHCSGINMVDNYDPKEEYDSLLGKMERREVLEIDNAILKSLKMDSLDIAAVPEDYTLPNELVLRITTLVEHCQATYPHWGIKDPRFCLTYHLWKEYLPEHKIIIVFRNPAQVVKHYAQYYSHFKKILRSYHALKAYHLHNRHIIRILKRSEFPYLVINYEDLMESDSIIKKLSLFTDKDIIDTRKPSLYRMNNKHDIKTSFLNLWDGYRAQTIYNEMKILS